MLKRTCHETCVATVKADDYSIYVEYALDDASVEFLDILNVVHFDKTVNAYVDRYEIEKINAAIAGGEVSKPKKEIELTQFPSVLV